MQPSKPNPSYADTFVSRGTTLASTTFVQVDPAPPSIDDEGFAARYDGRELLGEGGMGEVRLYKDKRIGREVALKAIRPGHGSRSDLRLRFVREARVQGQLEHPSIVPVYDLSLRPEPAFFTMKRVRGVTLEQVIDRLRAKDADVVARFSRRKLLTAFDNVCLAVDYAHAHGVVHRDLKPANVMLGDFGEVYVLDWGVAKVGDAPDVGTREEGNTITEGSGIDTTGDVAAKTAAGALMGTLGYMAPEQLRGETVDARADVYALGATLFEMLALTPLHDGKKATDVVASTLRGAEARASQRTPDRDVPPELEAICVRATALAPEDRFATARELHEALERYLDGDRDVEQRAKMAEGHARAAAEAAARSARSEGATSEKERSAALREVGRALALDPTNPSALETALVLRMQPPRVLPEEARARIELRRLHTIRESARAGAVVYASTFLYLPLILLMGIHDPVFIGFLYGMLALTAGVAYWTSRRPSYNKILVILAMGTTAYMALSRIAGPFILVPAIAAANTASFAVDPARWRRVISLVVGCMTVGVPLGLEWLGVLSPSYAFHDGTMVVLPHLVNLSHGPTELFFFLVTVATVVTSGLFMSRVREALEGAERQMQLQAWQLRQLAPEAMKGATELALSPLALCPPGDPVAR